MGRRHQGQPQTRGGVWLPASKRRVLMSTEPWVSVDDVAKHLSVAKDSIYRWIEQKGLPSHKVGRLWKFKLSEVDDWVRAGGAKADETAKENGR